MTAKILILGTMECCLFTSFLFFTVLPRRKHFPLRLGIMALLEMLLAFPLLLFRNQISSYAKSISDPVLLDLGMSLNAITELILYLLLLTLLFLICCKITFQNALYCSVCAYLTQDFAYTLFVFLFPAASHRGGRPVTPHCLWIEIFILLLCNGAFYHWLILPVISRLEQLLEVRRALIYMLFILMISRILGTKASVHFTAANTGFFRISILYDLLLTFSTLTAQILIFQQAHYKQRLLKERKLRMQEYRNFDAYRESVNTLRKKAHDMKHIIAALKQEQPAASRQDLLLELQDSIDRYDASLHTGNTSLDALLARVWNQCKQQEILWTCMADGRALEFIDPFDLYIMLGNALDNAIECLCQIPEKEKRFLSINIRKKNCLILISVRNYCQQMPDLIQGLPVTTKNENREHGYGMKNIQDVVLKYDGQMQVRFEHNTFILNILFPAPDPIS